MKKWLLGFVIGITASVISLLSVNAFADVSKAVTHDRAKTGIVIGVQGGYAQNNVKDNFKKLPITFKKGNLFGGATIGYEYAVFNELAIGAETGIFYGKSISKIDNTKVNDLLVPIAAIVKYVSPIGLDLFAKGGIVFVNLSAEESGYSYTVNFDHHWAPALGGGLGYDLKDINIFVQYAHIFRTSDHLYSTDGVTLGLTLTLPVCM